MQTVQMVVFSRAKPASQDEQSPVKAEQAEHPVQGWQAWLLLARLKVAFEQAAQVLLTRPVPAGQVKQFPDVVEQV